MNDRGEQAREIDIDRNGQVHIVVNNEFAIANRCVHVRVVAQRVDDCTRDEWQIVKTETFRSTELVAM